MAALDTSIFGLCDEELMSTLDVVVPVFNEVGCLPELVRRLGDVRAALREEHVDLAVVFVDDGSTDASPRVLDELARELVWVSAVHLVRNFGHQLAVTAGLDASGADYAVLLDADLQDPPELIPMMLARLRHEGVDVVYGQRRHRSGESRFKLGTASVFYRLLRWVSGIDIPADVGDFRVMTRRVVVALNDLPEHHRLLRAIIPWLGFESRPFVYDRDARFAGETKYPLRKMVVLAAHAIISFSTFPIRLIQGVGILLAAAAGLTAACSAMLSALGAVSPSAWWWLTAGLVLQTGLILASIGVVGGYVFRIQDETKRRPLYVRTDRPLPRTQAPARAVLRAPDSAEVRSR